MSYGLWLCLIVLALAPLPLGSGRPVAWVGWSIVVGLIGVIQAGEMARKGQRVDVRNMIVVAVLFMLFCLIVVLQVLPIIGQFGAVIFVTALGDTVESSTLSLAPGATCMMLLRMITFGVFFWVVSQVTVSTRATRFFLAALFAIVTAYAFAGLFFLTQGDTFLGSTKWAYPGSATASFVNRNSYAAFLSFGLVVGITMVSTWGRNTNHTSPRWRGFFLSAKPYQLAALAIIIAALIATQSRLGFLSGMVGAITVLLASAARYRGSPAGIAGAFALLVLVTGALYLAFGSGLTERLGSLDSSVDDRLALYSQIFTMIQSRPLLGFGGGAFEFAYPLFHLPPVAPDLVWDKGHSSYLTLFVEFGVVAGLLPILIYATFFAQSVMLTLTRRGEGLAPIAVMGCLVVVAIHSTADFPLEIEANTLAMVALLALLPSAAVRYNRS